jgi:hypothetical protein
LYWNRREIYLDLLISVAFMLITLHGVAVVVLVLQVPWKLVGAE